MYAKDKFPKKDEVKIMFLQSNLEQPNRNIKSRRPWMKTNLMMDSLDPEVRSMEDADKHSEAIIAIILKEIRETYDFLEFRDAAKRIFLAGKGQGAMLTLYI